MSKRILFVAVLLALPLTFNCLTGVAWSQDYVPVSLVKKAADYYATKWQGSILHDTTPYYSLDGSIAAYAFQYMKDGEIVGTVFISATYDRYPFLMSYPGSASHTRYTHYDIIRNYCLGPMIVFHEIEQGKLFDPFLKKVYLLEDLKDRPRGPIKYLDDYSPKDFWNHIDEYGHAPITTESSRSGAPKATSRQIEDVPAYDQEDFNVSCCGPNASAQVLAYWDQKGYGVLLDNGVPSGEVPDRGPAHEHELAYALMRVQDFDQNVGTYPDKIAPGIEEVANAVEWANELNFDASRYEMVQWTKIVEEIDSNRPMVLMNLDWYHYVTIYGYDQTSGHIINMCWGHWPYIMTANFDNMSQDDVNLFTVHPNNTPTFATIHSEDFEGDNGANDLDRWWTVTPNGWTRSTIRSHNVSTHPQPEGGNPSYSLRCDDLSPYGNNQSNSLTYGPFSTQGKNAGEFSAYIWCDIKDSDDYVALQASVDGISFYGTTYTGNHQSWNKCTLDLTAVPSLGSVMGKDEIWVRLYFYSDGSDTSTGAYVDDAVIKIWGVSGIPLPPTGLRIVE